MNTSTVECCLNQNYLCFQGNYYKQADGLEMVFPFSPFLAEMFMDKWQTEFLKSEPLAQHAVYWYRYVDDILCLWKRSTRQLGKFLENMNQWHSNIKVSMELGGPTINFLDFSILTEIRSH